ncbi:MAG: hypothetical protein QGH20_02030 [Candidatus Latescibacteria bacterium]|nr:hypothetical protein [Candidatus Latescibacterota bacterium]
MTHPPKTWDEFLAAQQKLMSVGLVP